MTYEERVRKTLDDDFGFFNVDVHELKINFELTNDEREAVIIATVGNSVNRFEPIDFCERFFIAKSGLADSAKFPNGKSDLNKQIKIFVGFRTRITQIIERFRRYAKGFPYMKQYDFDSFIRQVESAINEAKLNVEIKLLNSQIDTNKSVIETNENIKTTNANIQNTNVNITNTNRNLIIIFLVTALISLLSFGLGLLNFFNDSKIEKLNKRLELKDSLIQSQNKVIQQLSNKGGH